MSNTDETPEIEEEEETRCVCGETDPPEESGMYIQCESCGVWQHGYCVGITGGQQDAPDKYWCERCKPELHHLYTTDVGLNRSIYKPVQEKKRYSRRSVRAQEESLEEDEEEEEEEEEDPEDDPEEEEDEDQKLNDRKRATFKAREEIQYQLMLEKAIKESKSTVPGGEDAEEREESEKPEKLENRGGREDEPQVEHVEQEEIQEEPEEPKEELTAELYILPEPPIVKEAPPKRVTKRKYTRHTPTPGPTPKSANIDLNNPIKPRLPPKQTSLLEMRRRIIAILEYISRTQEEISQEQEQEQDSKESLSQFVENKQFITKIDNIFSQNNSNLSSMNDLTEFLVDWQQKFC